MTPWTFRQLRTIRILNMLSVWFGLAAFALRLASYEGNWLADDFALTPLGLAMVAAWSLLASLSLRGRSRIGKSTVRWGWLGFTALVMMAFAALAVASAQPPFGVALPLGALVLSALGAAMLGGVASLLPLAILGLPVAHAQSLAQEGLAGEERGERMVGIVAAVCGALIGIQLVMSGAPRFRLSELMPIVPAVVSILLGLGAAFLANGRERSRTAFVKEVEAGRVEGYRVDLTEKGKALVRVTAPAQDTYRAAERHDALIELDEAGAALHHIR